MQRVERPGAGAVRLVPHAIFVVLALLTFLVWRQQVLHQRRLLARHTEDVCVQAARRLQSRLESRLRVATIFARRWSTHETRDFSRQRFDEFASLLVRELPEYHTIRLLPPDPAAPDWVVPLGVASAWNGRGPQRALLAQARRLGLVLSEAVKDAGGKPSFFAVLPLERAKELLGFLVVEFSAISLINELFHARIRSEFELRVTEGDSELFLYAPEHTSLVGPLAHSASFDIRGRTFSLTVVPRSAQMASTGWAASWPIPLFGVLLSTGLALLAHLLSRRMELFRQARDHVVQEMEQRERAQRALKASEARYHSVFDSATDGLVVLDDDDRVVEANPAASAMHGWEPEAFLGRSYQELIEPGHKHLYRELKRQLEQFGSVRLDSVHVCKGGGTIDVEVRGAPFSYGGDPRILAILTDVSDRKQAVQRHAMLSRKVLMAQEEERARVSRELHDELGQILTALHLELDWLQKKACSETGPVAGAFDGAVEMVENAANELRVICRGLRPQLLDDLGLEPAVRLLVEEVSERTGLAIDLQIQLNEAEQRMPPELALCTYRILQESLNNVTRHAQAGEVTVTIAEKEGELMLSVYDDGKGFDAKINEGQGVGIAGMRERASLVNGMIDIRSEPFQGTRVTFRVDLEGRL